MKSKKVHKGIPPKITENQIRNLKILGSNRRRGFTIPTIFRAKNLNYQEEIPKEGSNRELNILPILRGKNLNNQQINIFDNSNITLDTFERLMVFCMISVLQFYN